MAVRPDFAPGQDYDLGFLTQLLRSPQAFEGTGLAEPMAHIGNTIAGMGGKPLTPEQMARTTAEAKRLMNGGVPREQLDELKKMLKDKVGEFFEAARNSEVYNLPPHLLDAKEYMAGQVRMMDNKTAAFSGANIGKTPEERQREREQNASSMLALFLDSLTAEMSNEDTGEVIDSVKQTLDEASVGGLKEFAPKVPGNIDLSARPRVTNADGSASTILSMSIGTEQGEVLIPRVSDDGRVMSEQEAIEQYRQTGRHLGIFADPQTATAYARALSAQQGSGQAARPIQQQIGGASGFEGRQDPLTGDVEMRKIEGPLAGMLPRSQEGLDTSGGSMDSASDDELLNSMSAPEIRDYLAEAEKLLSETPERQIAKLQEPNAAMWIGVAIAGILFPNMRPALFALPFQVALGEMDRQQKLYDQAYLDANDRQKQHLSLLLARSSVQQQEKNRAVTVRGQDLQAISREAQDAIELAKIGAAGDAAKQKRLDELRDDVREATTKGAPESVIMETIREINSFSTRKDAEGNVIPIIDAATAKQWAEAGNRKWEAGVSRTEGLGATTWYKLDESKRTQWLRDEAALLGLDKLRSEQWIRDFNIANMPQEFAMKLLKDAAYLAESQQRMQDRAFDNSMQEAGLEVRKLSELKGIALAQQSALSTRRNVISNQIAKLQSDMALTGETSLQAEIDKLQDELRGTEVTDPISPRFGQRAGGIDGALAGLDKYIGELGKQIDAVDAAGRGIDVPQLGTPPPTNVTLPSGYQRFSQPREDMDTGKWMVGPGMPVDLDRLYGYGAKTGDKRDCSGFVCDAVTGLGKVIGEADLKSFPSGTSTQREWLQQRAVPGAGKHDPRWSMPGFQFDPNDRFSTAVKQYNAKLAEYEEDVAAFNEQVKSLPPGQSAFLTPPKFDMKPPKIDDFLMPGDLIYHESEGSESGWHVVIFAGKDKDGKPLVMDAFSASAPEKQQVGTRAFSLHEWMKSNSDKQGNVTKEFEIYRFSPGAKKEK